MEPIAAILAVDAARRHAESARPGAPVVPYTTRSRKPASGPARRAVVRSLRRLADGLELRAEVP